MNGCCMSKTTLPLCPCCRCLQPPSPRPFPRMRLFIGGGPMTEARRPSRLRLSPRVPKDPREAEFTPGKRASSSGCSRHDFCDGTRSLFALCPGHGPTPHRTVAGRPIPSLKSVTSPMPYGLQVPRVSTSQAPSNARRVEPHVGEQGLHVLLRHHTDLVRLVASPNRIGHARRLAEGPPTAQANWRRRELDPQRRASKAGKEGGTNEQSNLHGRSPRRT